MLTTIMNNYIFVGLKACSPFNAPLLIASLRCLKIYITIRQYRIDSHDIRHYLSAQDPKPIQQQEKIWYLLGS